MSLHSRRRVVGVAVAALLLLNGIAISRSPVASAAAATTRYAAVEGTGKTCTKVAPCDIVEAINNATAGADVIVNPGSYGSPVAPLTHELIADKSMTIHSVANKAVPTITSSANFVLGLSDGASADRLHIVAANDNTGVILDSATANHLRVNGGDIACLVKGTLYNSVCTSALDAAVENQVGTTPATAILRNVTAIATGDVTAAVECKTLFSGGACQLQLINSIADSSGYDGVFADAVAGSTATISAFNSEISSSGRSGAGGGSTTIDSSCITTNPSFIDKAGGNFHEAAGSPTIDAGFDGGADNTGDADGLPRVLGKAVDMGAYEFAPPPGLSKVKVTKRGKHSLHLFATVRTQKLPNVVTLVARHGNTTAKGKRKVVTGSSKAKVVKLIVKHLKRHTSYTVEVTVQGLGGQAGGSATGSTR